MALNGFTYKTDSSGRVVSAEGEVKIPTDDRKQNPDINSKDKRDTDDKGHIIGHQLGGKEDKGNLVPQDMKLNRGEYNKLEKELAEFLKIEVSSVILHSMPYHDRYDEYLNYPTS